MRAAIAVYDCTADDDGELSFKKGDTLVDVIESNEDGWYQGRLEGTSFRGLFPYNYVKLLDESQKPPPPVHTLSKPITPKRHNNAETSIQFGTSVSPTLSLTWSVISTKDDDDAHQSAQSRPSSDRKASTAADAFEKAMMPTPHPVKGSGNTKPSCVIPAAAIAVPAAPESPAKEKPLVAPKPTQLKKSAVPSTVVASRVRSYSTSAAHVLASDGSARPLNLIKSPNATSSNTPIIRPKPINNTKSAAVASVSSRAPLLGHAASVSTRDQRVIFDNDVLEDDDGYQVLVTPSLLRQRRPSALISPKPLSSPKNSMPSLSASRLENLPAANNPAPRLPSRPSPVPGRRPRTSKSYSSGTSSPTLPPKPKPKPKTTPLASNALSSCESKGRSVSDPPPIQPKPPALASGRPDTPVDSKHDTIRKPPPPPAQQLLPRTLALPVRPVTTQRNQLGQQLTTATDNVLNRTRSKSNGWKPSTASLPPARTASTRQVTEPTKKPPPPPPPPSRPVQDSTNRYEELFNEVHDDGVVDGPTAKIIWRRSRVSDDMLARIWQQCDPRGDGLLNKQAFIQGMREIDAILAQKSTAA